MATATISTAAVKVTTDLGTAPYVGPSVAAVSASQHVTADVYHRINPYFYRLSELTETLKVKFKCKHTPLHSVAYASRDGESPSHSWSGTMKVSTNRTRRTAAEAVEQQRITVTETPTATVQRTIVCTFKVVERYNSRTQRWEKLPPAPGSSPACNLTFELTP